MARLVTISKIRVENLPPTWSAGWETRYFKVVISCAGSEVGETRLELLDTDGFVEWPEPVRLSMRRRTDSLVAIVVSSGHSGGDSWCLVPGCRFEGLPMKVGKSVWRPASAHPGAGPNLWAQVETVLEGEQSQGAADLDTFLEGEKSQGIGGHLERRLEGETIQGAAEHVETPVEEGKSQGAGRHLETALEGDKSHGVVDDMKTLLEEYTIQGADGHLQELLQEENSQEAAGHLETFVETHKSPKAAEHFETVVERDGSQLVAEDLKTLAVEAKSRQGTAERLRTGVRGSGGGGSAGSLDTFVQGYNRQGAVESHVTLLAEHRYHGADRHLEPFLDGAKLHGTVVPPPTSDQETREGGSSYPAAADSASVNEGQTAVVSARASSSAAWTRGAVEGHGWLAQHETLTSSLYGRGSFYPSPSHKPWASNSSLMRKGDRTSAGDRHGNVYARSSVGKTDKSMPKSASLPSFFPGLGKSIRALQRKRGKMVPKQTSAPVLRSNWSGDSSAPRPTGVERLMSLFRRNTTHARTPFRNSYGPTQDSCETSTWKRLVGGRLATEEKALVKHGVHTSRTRSWFQLEEPNDSTTSTAVSDPSTGVGERNAAPRLRRGVNLFPAPDPPSGKRRRRVVHALPTPAQPTASRAPTAPPSCSKEIGVELGAARSSGAEVPLAPDVGGTSRSPVRSPVLDLAEVKVEVEGTSLLLPQSPYPADSDSPPLSYDSMFTQMPLHSGGCALHSRGHASPARSRAVLSHPTYGTKDGDSRDELVSSSVDCAKGILSTGNSTMLENHTTGTPAHVLSTSHEEPFHAERLMPRVKSSSAEMRQRGFSVLHTTADARAPSLGAVETAHRAQTEALQPFETFANIEDGDPVVFTCVSPQSVCGGGEFQLRVSASSRQVQDDLSRTVSREGAKEGAIAAAGTLRIARGKRVTVQLELPKNVFQVLDPDSGGGNEAAANPPASARDFVWNGIEQEAKFNVACLPGAATGAVDCGVLLVEGSSSTQLLSFRVEIVEAEHASENLCTALEEVEVSVAEDDLSKPATSDAELKTGTNAGEETADPRVPTRSSVVCPPPPFLLASRVNPGPSVHESTEHGFRLTVQESSLHGPIGPITVQAFAQVVKCENDGQDYLVKTIVDCLPSGASFPDKPLLMDFIVEDASFSEPVQVLVRKGGAREWRTIKSEKRVDRWGTYLRAAVSDFCRFTWGTRINPSDPARLESCSKKGVIEVQNATEDEVYFVLVPVAFDSDRMSRVTYTGNIAFGVAGLSFGAAGGSGYESAVKRHMLPAGFIPDEISVAAGGKFQFLPPPGASQGKLLVATITEDSEAGLSVKVVVFHGKFNTPEGKRRVILPVCLRSKSRISARLGPDDIPVNMVMIMAGMGSKVTTITEAASSPSSTTSVEPPSTVSPAFVLPRSAQSRDGTTRSCTIS